MKLTDFTGKYQLSKTLKFELIPQGNTLENIHKKGLINIDQERSISYQKMKKTIDEYHKWFIGLALSSASLENLERFSDEYFKSKEERDEVTFSKIKTDLRKEIVKKFGEGESKQLFKNLFSKELIKDDLEEWIKTQHSELYFDESFKNFTTYFGGFYENRKNMYSVEEHSTAIAYRIVHENLPKFLDNIRLFEKLTQLEELDFSPILVEMEMLIQGTTLDEVFDVQYYNNVLNQKGIDLFNHIIGGYTPDKGKKIKGLNEYINLYNQQQKDKKNRVPKFKQLYKQILSDRESISFLPDAFEDDNQLCDAVTNYYTGCLTTFQKDGDNINVLTEISKLVGQLTDFDTARIYLRNDVGLTTISQKLFNDYNLLKTAKSYYYDTVVDPDFQQKINKPKLSDSGLKKLYAKKDAWNIDYISIGQLQTCLDTYLNDKDTQQLDVYAELMKKYSPTVLADYFNTHFTFEVSKAEKIKKYDFVSLINEKYSGVEGFLNTSKENDYSLKQDKERVGQLKDFLDSILGLLRFVKPLYCQDENITEKDDAFYADFNALYEQLNLLTPLYNKVRNYATQKPFETKKVKLNFENAGNFLNGWVDSQTEKSDNGTQYGGYLLRKKNGINEYDYFLGICSDTKILRLTHDSSVSEYERLEYYQLKTATVYENSYPTNESYQDDKKQLVKAILNHVSGHDEKIAKDILIDFDKLKNKETGEYTPSSLFNKLLEKYPLVFECLIKDKDFIIANDKTIDNLKTTILSLSRVPEAQKYQHHQFMYFTEPIAAIDELAQNKVFNYFKISESELKGVMNRDKKPLFLFKISNKDLSYAEKAIAGLRKTRGLDNLHTMYFKTLMEGNQSVYDIGTAEVFFRKASLESLIPTHPKNEPIKSKNPLKQNNNVFKYDLIKDKRYTVDKFQFHLSIIQNYKEPKIPKDFNKSVNQFLQNNPDINIIGLDRGERHLIYLTLVNQKGEILKQESLNVIKSEKYNIETPYHTLLENKEKQRAEARVEWGAIESIKELKEGYISQVVHKIATMMVENNAIVVMEDLNFGFKRGRFHVEKQVYQKLEKMLIDKLNYLVFKTKDNNEPGGVLKALQLTSKFESFKKMGKQMGFVFYVPAWNTSKIDPSTGFVDFLKPKYESILKAQEFFSKFKSITYNVAKTQFEFNFDYSAFTTRADDTKTNWKLCADNHTRYFYNRALNLNKGGQEAIKVAEELEDLFGSAGIVYGDGNDIKNQLVAQSSADFFKRLMKLLSVTLSLRHNNGKKGTEEQDFILSPVTDENGGHFCSLTAPTSQPQDADANGAYHIALKGLWVLNQLENTKDLSKPQLAISNKDWLNFVQKKPYVI